VGAITKMTAEKILTRIKRLKVHIDKGQETSVHNATCKYLKSSHFTRALLQHNAVHISKNGIVRWNGLAVNLKLAKAVLDDARVISKNYLKASKKTNTPKQTLSKEKLDINDLLDKQTLSAIAKALGISDNTSILKALEDNLNAMEEMKIVVNELRYNVERMKGGMWDLHADHKERLAETITQQIGAQA